MGCSDRCQTKKAIKFVSSAQTSLLNEFVELVQCCKSCCNRNKDTLLIIASKQGHCEIIGILISAFGTGYIEHFNKTGKTALHEAVQFGQIKVVEILLGAGAKVNALKQADWTPLMLACEKSDFDMVKLLISYGADPHLCNKDGWNPSHIAARSNSIQILEYIHTLNSTFIRNVSNNGRTLLHSAALNNSESVVMWLLEQKLCPNQGDSSGLAPLMDGARMGHLSICGILLQHGADILRRDHMGRSILHHVTQAAQLEALKWCVEKAEVRRTEMLTTLDLSCNNDAKLLSTPFVDWPSDQGSTALHYAAKESRCREISALLQFGADKCARDKFGRMPEQMTRDVTVVTLLNS